MPAGPAVLRGLLASLVEHIAAWPLTALFDRYQPAREELPKLVTSRRAFGQATIRNAVFGVVLGLLEDDSTTAVHSSRCSGRSRPAGHIARCAPSGQLKRVGAHVSGACARCAP